MKFVVDQELMQRILNYIKNSKNDMQAVEVIQLVDDLRALQLYTINFNNAPVKNEEKQEEAPKEETQG